MITEDFASAAYLEGVSAGKTYNANPNVEVFDSLPNPYEYGSHDWQLWNLGWNHTTSNP
jgi:hypothetical protein